MVNFNTTFLKSCLLLSLVLLLSACAREKFHETTDLADFQSKYEEKERQYNRGQEHAFSPSILSAQSTGDYRLGPGDLISVKVYETDELNSEVRVSSRGNVSLPLLDTVDVFNLTVAEVEEKIETLYKEKYLHDPHVIVYIKEHVSGQITLVGSIVKPGTYDYVSERRLLDVIAIASGLSETAGSIAYVTRKNPVSKERTSYVVDLDKLLKQGDMNQNMVVLGGDVVFIPEAGQCFIDGAVRKPGTYSIETKMTVTEALSMAGGLASYADDDSIKLIRYMGSGKKREIITLSYSDLQGGVGDTLFLQDQDIIYAESSSMGLLTSGGGLTIGFLGTGVSYKDPEANVQSK